MTLIYRVYSVCSSYKNFHEDVQKLKIMLQKNLYPESFIDFALGKFLLAKFTTKQERDNDKNKFVRIVLPFWGKLSLDLKRELLASSRKILPKDLKLQVIFKGQNSLSHLFRFKDKIPLLLNSHVIYKYQCSCCSASYVGLTRRHILTRWSEHMGVSPYTGKHVAGQTGDVRSHMLHCKTKVALTDFQILERDNMHSNLRIKESLLIQKTKPSLNKDGASTPLLLF